MASSAKVADFVSSPDVSSLSWWVTQFILSIDLIASVVSE